MPYKLTECPDVAGLVVDDVVVARRVSGEHVGVERSEIVLLVHHSLEGAHDYTLHSG